MDLNKDMKKREQRKLTPRQAKLFAENRQTILAAERLEGREQVAAFAAYREMRVTRNQN